MDRQAFLTLTSSSQWLLFLALAMIIFSWVERKKWAQITGQAVFVALAIFAVWVLQSGQIEVPATTGAETVSAEIRAITFFKGLAFCGVVAAIGLILHGKKSTLAKIPNLILIPVALLLFFMVYSLQRL